MGHSLEATNHIMANDVWPEWSLDGYSVVNEPGLRVTIWMSVAARESLVCSNVERGSSAVECRTRNRASLGFVSSFGSVSKIGHFRSLHWRSSWLSCINDYLAIDSGGNVSDLVIARNCCMARMLPGEAELVSEWTGLSGRAKSVQRFERSDALDTALYKNYLYLLVINLYLNITHLCATTTICYYQEQKYYTCFTLYNFVYMIQLCIYVFYNTIQGLQWKQLMYHFVTDCTILYSDDNGNSSCIAL